MFVALELCNIFVFHRYELALEYNIIYSVNIASFHFKANYEIV